MSKMVAIALVLLVFSVLGAAFGQILLKKAVDGLNGKYEVLEIVNPLKFLSILREAPLLLVGIMIYGVGFMIWIAALSKLELSFMYPLAAGLGYVLVALLSFAFLKENFTAYRIAGIALVMLGSVFLLKSA